MKEDLVFLELDEVLAFHDALIDRYGGESGLRDLGLLESALAQPQSMFEGEYLHPGVFAMAAAYAFHIAQNQPFVDGNKRTGLLAALTFLDLNGFPITAASDLLYQAMLDVAAHKLDKAGLAALFQELAQS